MERVEAGVQASIKGGGVDGAGMSQVNGVGVLPGNAGLVVLNQHHLLHGGEVSHWLPL